jgi:[acyl-carrier-protein] S-malonyltransferase
MAKVAFVFPGQGSQVVGMGRLARDQNAAAAAVFAAADQVLGESLSGLCFEGPAEQLQLTANTQPAILTTSIALLRAFGETCDVTAGHSLGEYSANVAAGTLSFEDAVKLVRVRGQYMQEAVPVGQGAMAAVLGGDVADIERACAETDGEVQPVNYNCPGQVVIAGEAGAVERASAKIKEVASKVRPLPVSAPFHSSLMRPAEARLEPHLRAATFSDPSVPIYTNVDASPITTGAAARDALVLQVSRAVRWQQTIERMLADGVGVFVEIGPGSVLCSLIARVDKTAKRVNIETPADFDKARALIKEVRG